MGFWTFGRLGVWREATLPACPLLLGFVNIRVGKIFLIRKARNDFRYARASALCHRLSFGISARYLGEHDNRGNPPSHCATHGHGISEEAVDLRQGDRQLPPAPTEYPNNAAAASCRACIVLSGQRDAWQTSSKHRCGLADGSGRCDGTILLRPFALEIRPHLCERAIRPRAQLTTIFAQTAAHARRKFIHMATMCQAITARDRAQQIMEHSRHYLFPLCSRIIPKNGGARWAMFRFHHAGCDCGSLNLDSAVG